MQSMPPIYITYLNRLDVEALALTDAEILAAVEAGLAAQGRGETVIEPRMHLVPEPDYPGHFNVLRGYVGGRSTSPASRSSATSIDNYKLGLPSELGAAQSVRSADRRAAWRSSTPPTSPTCAPAR